MNLYLFIHPAPYNSIFTDLCLSDKNTTILFYDSLDIGHTEWGIHFSKLSKCFLPHSPVRKYLRLFRSILAADSVVIPGYSRPESIFSSVFAFILQKKLVLSCDTTQPSSIVPISLIQLVYSGFWAASSCTTDYLISNNISKDVIFTGCYTITSSSYLPSTPSLSWISNHRDSHSYLFVGKLIPSRCILTTISAFFDAGIPNSTLYVVGDGPDLFAAQKIVAANSDSKAQVVLLGALPFSQIHQYYFLCSNYVHFGGEPFSTALELAALYGLHIASSLNCGFIHDLIKFGGTPVSITNSPSSLSLIFHTLADLSAKSTISQVNAMAVHKRLSFSLDQFTDLNIFLDD
jgi:hypothetical protein